MSMDGQGTKRRRKIAENFNLLSRVPERYRRQTTDRQTDGRQHIANAKNSHNEIDAVFFKLGCCHLQINSS